jgi:LacI family transcriptional regulator
MTTSLLSDLPTIPEVVPAGPPREVAVLVEIDDTWGRNVTEAISHYAQQAGWQLLIAPKDEQRRLRVPEGWSGDGVIALLRDRSLIEHVHDLGTPVVDVCNMFPELDWVGRVNTDDVCRAEMALEHFRSRLLEHFACYSPRIGRYSDGRAAAFRDVVEKAGYRCQMYPPPEETSGKAAGVERERLAAWLASLPKPVGILAADPYPARQLVEVCSWKGMVVPDEIAILSGDEDELLCNVLSPQISSIELASHRIGHEACQVLNEMMLTGIVPARPRLLPPLRICARRSTEHVAIEDRELSSLVKMIWERATDGIQVPDLVRAATMSRRTLEQRFRDLLGRTPAEEIRRVRVEKARQLIVTTSLSVSAIALACGFSSGPYMSQAFKKRFGITPSELRIGRKDVDEGSSIVLESRPALRGV